MAEIPSSDRNEPRYSDEEVDEIIAGRATIEQAKGVLMHIYDVDAEQAFKMLRAHSRTNGVKLRLLAQRLLDSPTLARNLWH
jgi:AmiR/NasT family two-component response regulator